MNVFIERTVVESFVSKVMPDIFEDEEESYLGHHCSPRWEWDLMRLETEYFADGMEEPDL